MTRIERLINLLAALLNTSRPLTAEEIRDKIAGYEQPSQEAFRRAFERDKEDLRAMGIPVEVVPTDPFSDQADGYIVPKDKYYLPDLQLDPDELAALHIAAQAVLSGGEQAASGMLKLSVDVHETVPAGPGVVWGADLAAEEPLLGLLYSATAERRPLQFAYERGSGGITERVVDPYALAHRRGHWYVVGHDHERGAIRSFKASRILPPVRQLEGSFEPPPAFEVDEHLPGEAWEVGADAQTAVVRFDPEMRWWPEQNLPRAELKEGADGALDVEIPVANLDALISWVIGFGGSVEIREPPEARARLLEHLEPFLGGGTA